MFCGNCKSEKPDWEFVRNKQTTRLMTPCKACKKVYNKLNLKERKRLIDRQGESHRIIRKGISIQHRTCY